MIGPLAASADDIFRLRFLKEMFHPKSTLYRARPGRYYAGLRKEKVSLPGVTNTRFRQFVSSNADLLMHSTALHDMELNGYKMYLKDPVTRGRALNEMLNTKPTFTALGRNVRLRGAAFGRPMAGLARGLEALRGQELFAIPFLALSAMGAKRGHLVSNLAGGAAELAVGGALTVIGGFLGGGIGALVLPFAAGAVGKPVEEGVQSFVELDRRMRRLNFGSTYNDTQLNLTMRQAAAHDMGSSLLNARKYLGQEAKLMHQ